VFAWYLTRRALALGALTLAASHSLRAQGAPPALPDTVPLVPTGEPQYVRLLHETAAPVLVAQRPFRVMLAPAATAAALDAADMLASLRSACLVRGPVSAPQGYIPGGVAVDATKYLVLIASSESTAEEGCATTWNASALGIWSGLSFRDRGAPRPIAPLSLRLLSNGVPLEPALSVARPALELEGESWRRTGMQLRYYYPMSVLVKSASGRRPDLVVQVWDARRAPTSLELTTADAERLEFGYSVWRLATSTGSARRIRLSPRRAVASEVRATLDLAATTADSGALRAAELLARTPSTPATAYDRDVATMLVAEALGQRGDSAAERAVISVAQDRRSCLAAPQGASGSLAAIVVASRSRPCPQHNPLATLGLGLVIPGGGHWMHGSKVMGAVATGAISSVFLIAYRQDATARNAYAQYEGSRYGPEATGFYTLANTRRASARRMAQIGLAVSFSDAVLAALVTAAQNREVSRGRL